MTASSNLETPSTTCASDASASREAASLASDNLTSVISEQVEAKVEPTTAPADRVPPESGGRLCGVASATNEANDQKPAEKSMTTSASDRNSNTKEAARLQTVAAGDTEDETDHGNRLAECEATKARDDVTVTPPPAQSGGGQSKFRRNVNNLHSLNYATNQQQQVPYDQQLLSISLPAAIQFQQNFVQPPPANIYNQPLVSWTCPVTAAGSGGPLREGPPPQLYGTPLLYHQPQLTCASSYYPHLQSAMVAANFAHAPLSHVPNYLPPPAVYTGHHHLYNHHNHHLHPDQLLLAPPPVASLQMQANHQLNQSRPSSPSSVSSVDTASETSRVIVDCGEPPKSFASVTTKRVATQETGQRNKGETRAQDAAAAELATAKHFSEPTPRSDNDQSSSDKHNTATLCDDEKAFARCSNRSSSSQPRQSRATAPADDGGGGGNLIRRDDNESKNDICRTTKHRQQRPLNESRLRVIQREAQIRGEADEQVGRPARQQRQQSRSDQLLEATNTTRAQTDTSTSRRLGPTALTDQQQNHCNQWKELRPDRQDQDLMVATGENLTDSSSTVVTSSSSSSNKNNNNNVNKSNSCLGGSGDCRRADDSDAEAPFREGAETQLNEHKVERQDEEQTTTTPTRNKIKTRSDDETTTKPVAELNPISINGTTFYHVNPAALIRPLATTIDGQGGQQFAPGYNYNVGATYQPMGGFAPNLMGYFQPHYQLVNDYLNQPPPGGRLVDHHLYYWSNTRQPPATAAATVPFELVQPMAFGLAGQRLEHPQHYGQLAGNLEQRPLLTYHHQVAGTCPRPYDQHFSYLPSSAIGNATQPTFELHQAPTGAPSSQTASQQQTPALQQQPPTVPTAAAAAAASVTSNSTGVSQLKLGYNLIPLLPINAIPTRVRQAYGMDKVWQDEFEQLFSQFVSQVVWTLVEVETNPNIRSSSRILAYKSRYIVRVGNGPATTTSSPDKNSADESGSVSSAPGAASPHAASETTGDDGVEDYEDDANSSWNGPEEDEQNCCCGSSSSATDAEERDQQQTSSEADESRRIRQGPQSSSSNGGESDCDSGAALNSTSGFSETTSQDLSSPSDLAGSNQQSPANSPPCLDSDEMSPDETNVANSGGVGGAIGNVPDCSTHNGRRFPLKFRMFIDSAKVRFCCDTCGHGWTSMKGRVVFWYELFELVDGPSRNNAASEGVSNLIGYCAYKLFGQQCDICKIENRFERPMWYPEEVTKVLCNLFNKIGQVYFGFRMPNIDKQRRAGKPKTSHNSLLCQACHDGVCTDRK